MEKTVQPGDVVSTSLPFESPTRLETETTAEGKPPTPSEPAEPPSATSDNAKSEEPNYPQGITLAMIFIGLGFSVLCVGLDRSIIATAVPKITDEFDSLDDIGWYGSAYLLTSCCFQLMFGKFYAELNVKWVFLVAVAIFEVGSIVCATAPSSTALILGRAVAGLGSSGIVTGALTILAHSVPLHNRPKFTGAIGAGAGIAQIIAPTIGGLFTEYATWRWCFWINLPIGVITIAVTVFLVHLPPTAGGAAGGSVVQALQKFDFLGTVVLVPAIVSLLLALQWGGSVYPWSSWRLILTLCIFAVFIVIWGGLQVWQGARATVPMRIIGMRSIACAVWFMFTLCAVLFVIVQYVPLWFQAIKGVSPSQSGVNFLAANLPQTVTAISSGFVTSKIGYYVPSMVASTVFSAGAAGMITRFGLDTSTGYWIGTLIFVGVAMGIGGQQSIMVPQTVLSGGDVALGTSLMIFAQTMSGTIFNSVANNILLSRLEVELAARAPQVDPAVVIATGASDLVASLQKLYPAAVVDQVLEAYAAALQRVWLIPVIMACLSVFGSVLMEWRSVKKAPETKTPEKTAEGSA